MADPRTEVERITVLRLIGLRATGVTGLLSDSIGAFGYFGWIYGLITYFAPNGFWKMSPLTLTIVGGSAVFFAILAVLILLVLGDLMRAFNGMKAGAVDSEGQMRKLSDQVRLAEESARTTVFRLEQKRAVENMAHVYGYVIKRRRHAYTIYASTNVRENGTGHVDNQLSIQCNRRAIGEVWRRTRSTIGKPFGQPQALKITPNSDIQVRVEQQQIGSGHGQVMDILQKFVFSRTLNAKDGAVQLSYTDPINDPAFLTYLDPAGPRTTDWVSAQAVEPIELLEIDVEFHDYRPERIRAEAFYGSGSQPLPQEVLAANDVLEEVEANGRLTCHMKIEYPIMGVTYRIIWDLPAKPTGGS